MRPLILFHRSLAPTGGIERDSLKCIQALLTQGRDLHIVVASLHSSIPEMLNGSNVHWYRLRTVKRPPYLGQWILWKKMLEVEKSIKRRLPNARSIAFEWLPIGDYLVGAQPPQMWWENRKRMGLSPWRRPTQRLWEAFVGKKLMERGTHLAVYSNEAKNIFISEGVPAHLVHRVIIPTDPGAFQIVSGAPREDILIMGSNPLLKGIDVALSAWSKIHQSYPELYLRIVAKGWKVKRMVRRSRLPRIRLSPFVPDPMQYYRTARLVLAPSQHESWGNIVPEALFCGIPVIVSKQTPSSEMVRSLHDGNVIVRTSDFEHDVGLLIDAIRWQLEQPLTRSNMLQRRMHAKRFQKHYENVVQWVSKC